MQKLELIRTSRNTGLRIYRTGDDYFVVTHPPGQDQVCSVVPNDMPDQPRTAWFGRASASGVSYVARPRTRANAMYWFRRLERR